MSTAGENWKKLAVPLPHQEESGRTFVGHTQGISTVIIHPKNNNLLYASGVGGIYKTENGGNTWRTFNEGLEERGMSLPITSLAIDTEGTILYAGTTLQGVFKRRIS